MPVTLEHVQRQSKVYVLRAVVDTSSLVGRERDSPRTEDYVLLTRVQLNSASDLGVDRLPRSHLAGLVVETCNLQQGSRLVTLHVCPTSAGSDVITTLWRQLLVPRGELWITVITSLVPNFREFQGCVCVCVSVSCRSWPPVMGWDVVV